MRFELYKIFSKKIVAVLLGLGLALAVFAVVQPALQTTVYTEQLERLKGLAAIRYERELQNQYAGQYTEEQLKELYEQMQAVYDEPAYQRPRAADGGTAVSAAGGNTTPLTDEAYWRYLNRWGVVSVLGARTFYTPLYLEELRASGDLSEFYYGAIVQSPADDPLIPPPDPESPVVQKLLQMYEALPTPVYGEYVQGWQAFFNTVPVFFQWFVGLLILVGLAPLFAEERSSGADKVLLAARYGKTRMLRSKAAVGLVYATVVFWGFALFFFCLHLAIYGASGLRAGVQLLAHCSLSPYAVSVGQALAGWALLGWGAALTAAAGTMLFSAAAANAFSAFIPAFIGYVLPMVSFAGVSPALHRAAQLLPANVIGAVDRLFAMPDFYLLFGALVEKKALCCATSLLAAMGCPFVCGAVFRRRRVSD